ncbi:MAG: ComEC/Rec2 family competence protein [Bacilli bacterium]
MQKLRHLDGISLFSLFYALLAFVLGGNLIFRIHSPSCLLVAVLALPFLFSSAKKGRGNVLVFLLAFLLGVGLFSIHLPVKEEKRTYEGLVIQAKANYFLFLSSGTRYYVYEKENTREFGDFLAIEGKAKLYETTEYESRFSFKDYLLKEGVSYQLSAYQIASKVTRPLRLREKEIAFLSHFSKEGEEAIDALLFDHKDYSSSFIQQASALGCLYFLSLSGVLYGGFLRISERIIFLRFNEKHTHMITWILGLFLLPFGLYKVGIWRVFLGRSLRLFLEWRNQKAPPNFIVLSLLGSLSVLVNPYVIFNGGFLLGYGLAFSLSLSSVSLAGYPGKQKRIMTVAFVLLFLLPMLASKGELHLFSALYSAIFMPVVYPFAFLSFVSFLSVPFVSFLNAYAHFLGEVVAFFEGVDLSLPFGQWGEAATLIYYIFYVFYSFLRSEGDYPGIGKLVALLITSILLQCVPVTGMLSEQVSFINVGQGDAILIRSGYVSVMIDTGGNLGFDLAQEVDIPYLHKEKIYHLDCLIASHSDYDHIGAGASLSRHFRINRFVDDVSEFPLTIGPLTFTNYNLWGGREENMESLVLGLDFMGKRWLFTGDAPIVIENKILHEFPTIDCDILKVGHHGSATSSSFAFLKQITPEMAIISVGARNSYGHPSAEVLKRLDSLGIPYRRTDQEGTITYESWWGKPLGSFSS